MTLRIYPIIQELGTIGSFDLFNSLQTSSSTTKSTLKLRDAEFQWLCDQGKPVFVSGLDLSTRLKLDSLDYNDNLA